MNITEANNNVENINAAIAELDARIATETNEHRIAVVKRDNLATLLANGEIKPDQVASVQAEPEGYATILAQYRAQRDQLTRALDMARLEVIAAEAEAEDSPLLTQADKTAMVAEIVDAMSDALASYVERINAHNAEWDRVNAQAVRSDHGTFPVRKAEYDPMPRVFVGDQEYVYHMNSADSLFTNAIAKKLADLR